MAQLPTLLIQQAAVVNEGKIEYLDVLVKGAYIDRVASSIKTVTDQKINAKGKVLIPGIIDDQVHFREPGMTHKADLYTESRAAVAGGITSYMEMPNTMPPTITQDLLKAKFARAAECSLANYSFYIGATNENLDELMKTDAEQVCGIKIFMGSSTGNLLVDDLQGLENIFKNAYMLIATHCEDEQTIIQNSALAKEQYGENIPFEQHPIIRSVEACYRSSSKAVELAKKYGTRLHVLHISTAKELELFDNTLPLSEKRITAEACIHHLWFNDQAYAEKGSLIKWNPAIKTEADRQAIFQAVFDNRIDVIATDHAPHTWEEKQQSYFKAPSGAPLVQHSLAIMLEFYHNGHIKLPQLVDKMCHAPAICYRIVDRGYIRDGYFADIVLVDLNRNWRVNNKTNVLYKCGWSPLDGQLLRSSVSHTIVSGNLVYAEGQFLNQKPGMPLRFKSI